MFTIYNGKVHYILQKGEDYIKTSTVKGEVYIPLSEVNLMYEIEFIADCNSDDVKGKWKIPLEYGNVKNDYVRLISELKDSRFKKGADGIYRKRIPMAKVSVFAKMRYRTYGGKPSDYETDEPIGREYFYKIFSDHLNAKEGRIVGPDNAI